MVMSFFPQHHWGQSAWQVLFELILAANYLDIKSLLDLTCAKVASMIKGKNTEDMLGIRGGSKHNDNVVVVAEQLPS